MRLLLAVSFCLLTVGALRPLHAQTAVEAGSTGNEITIEVVNDSDTFPLNGVLAEVVEAPAWLQVSPASASLGTLSPGAAGTTSFAFGVAPDANGQRGTVVVAVRTAEGDQWSGSFARPGAYVEELRFEFIARQNAAVAYVIDRSGSMSGSPLQNAKSAAAQGIYSLADGDELSVVAFSSSASVVFPLRRIEDTSTRASAAGVVNALGASGSTSIGSGLLAAYNQLQASSAARRDYVLLSDGEENRPPYAADVLGLFANLNREGPVADGSAAARPVRAASAARSGDPVHRIHAIAYGQSADEQLLAGLAAQTGGLFFFAPDRDDPLALAQIFEEIQGDITGAQRLAAFAGALATGERTTHPFEVGSDATTVTVKLLWDAAEGDFALSLTRPDGTPVVPGEGVEEVSGPGIRYYTLYPDSVGTWAAEVEALSAGQAADYALVVTAQSSLRMTVALGPPPYITGAPVLVTASLKDNGVPVTGAVVQAEVTPPSQARQAFATKYREALGELRGEEGRAVEEGARRALWEEMRGAQQRSPATGPLLRGATLTLYDDGAHGDGAAADGTYGAFVEETTVPGSYTFAVTATGTRSDGSPFSRSSSESFFVEEGVPNQPPTADAGVDQSVECDGPAVAEVTLDGSASADPEGTALTYTWTLGGETLAGPTSEPLVSVSLPLGPHTVELRVTDEAGGAATATASVTVEDTTPPLLTVAASPLTLWPPNHKYVGIALDDLGLSATDVCDAGVAAASVVVAEARSDEPEDAQGDGSTLDDMVVGADCRSVDVRAERAGGGNGRVYGLTLAASDASGNVVDYEYVVSVPPSRKAEAFDDGDTGYAIAGCEPVAPALADGASAKEEPVGSSGAEVGGAEASARTSSALPAEYAMYAPYPNPARGSFRVPMTLPSRARVVIEAFDVLGRRVLTVADEVTGPGARTFEASAAGLTNGVYILRARVVPEGKATPLRFVERLSIAR